MATSGSSNFTATRTSLIEFAARQVNAIGSGVTMGPQMLSDFNYALNSLTKSLQASGVKIWTVTEATLFPQANQARYNLGGAASTDHATMTYVATELSADEASGQTILSVADDAGISSGDYIGIMLDSGSLHWTTVNGAPAGDLVTIALALADSASEGNAVYAYTSKIVQPLKVVAARTYDPLADTETDIGALSHLDYQALPNKRGTGSITQYHYDRQLSAGYMNLWQVPEVVADLVNFTWWRPLQDFDSASDNPDLPQEWIAALQWNLAMEMSVQYPIADRIYQRIVSQAERHLNMVRDFDRDGESVFFQPDNDC